MRTHRFMAVLSGIAEITPELAEALYEATQGDIEFNMRDGVASLEFSRTAPSLHAAVTAAIQEVENASVGVRIVRVETETANTIARIDEELLATGKSEAP